MRLSTVFGWFAGLLGVGLIGLGALLMVDSVDMTVPLVMMMVGLAIILVDMTVLSYVRRQRGLGVIY